ncbi:disintegrin and metalloproteinase domain-containing protein 18-like isoform X6 [Podarcis raffonei]|uniref:disintegrin and metalloproteinase domain-containing protein 18-like isoform X6 n=1 Tax=Podarcis raffonei TaxID=65483 RepID=UPI00232912C7|nr:disintegrin and metalloproteinase domain-containing protein 18-like isoform X6 [Podarcis raffonei]
MKLLAAAAALLLFAAGLDCQTFLHITYPKKIPSNMTEDGLGPDESTQTYMITIKKKTYTIHLQQQTFLPNDFLVYTYNQGGFVHPNSPHIQSECFYQGYIQGFPNSVAILSTCYGLRGLLQFENVSYGIEHLKSSANFEHLIYQINNKNLQSPLRREDLPSTERQLGSEGMPYKLLSDTVPLSDVTKVHRYIEIYIVLDKGLYNFLGGSREIVTDGIAQLIGFVNSIFSSLNITVVLSSLEFWTDHNKISTSGEPDVLLRKFLRWKNSYLVLRPHDLALLLVYREKPNYVGAGFMGKLCLRNFDAGVALYQKSMTKEPFSVILAQLLGLNLGMEYDNGKECKCPGGFVCIMNTEAVLSSGIKAFSSCSIKDFQNFIKFKGAHCLSNRPNLKLFYKKRSARSKALCGNGVLEAGEKCDCGSEEECKYSKCCTSSCTFLRGAVCSNELCCENCQSQKVLLKHVMKKLMVRQIDLDTVGLTYERDLRLVLSDTLCISLDLQQPEGFPDPMLVKDGTKCGTKKVCIKQVCEKYGVLKYDCDPTKKCFGHGICNNKRNCHCDPGWAPPNCKEKGGPLGGSIDSGLRMLASDITERVIEDNMRTWVLLSIFLFLPIVVGSAILIVKWARISKYCIDDSESLGDSESYTRSDEYSMSDKTSIIHSYSGTLVLRRLGTQTTWNPNTANPELEQPRRHDVTRPGSGSCCLCDL